MGSDMCITMNIQAKNTKGGKRRKTKLSKKSGKCKNVIIFIIITGRF